jgi:hypothetical protein
MENGTSEKFKSLADVIADAVASDDLNHSCRIIQDFLGVEDGALASLCFADLTSDAAGDCRKWLRLTPGHRRERLVAYIKSEVDMMAVDPIAQEIEIFGFTPWAAGGGCTTLAHHLPGGGSWFVSAVDSPSIPRRGDDIYVAHYDTDGETILFEAEYEGVDFDCAAFVHRVAESYGCLNLADRKTGQVEATI